VCVRACLRSAQQQQQQHRAPSQLGDAAIIYPAWEAVFKELAARPSGWLPPLNISFSTPARFYSALAAEVTASQDGARPIAFDAQPADDMLPLIGCEMPTPWTGFYGEGVRAHACVRWGCL
jgi:hypothetical protein